MAQRTRTRRESYGEVRDWVLSFLLELGKATVDSFFPEKYPSIVPPPFTTLERHLLRTRLYRLKRQGLLVMRREGRDALYTLSDNGRIEALIARIRQTRPAQWDRKWRVVIFDVPERNRKQRDKLRLELVNLGFIKLQASVWVTPWAFTDDLREIFQLLHLRPYMRLLEVNQIDSDHDLLRLFSVRK